MRLSPGVSFAARYVIQGRVRDSRLYREVPAIDALADEPVMLWLIRQRLLPSPQAQARLLAEAGRLHRLKTDGLLGVLDAGMDGDNVYVAVPDLRRRAPTMPQLEHGRGLTAALSVARQLAPLLDRAHAQNVTHGFLCVRDLIFLRERVVLAGAGLWRMFDRAPLLEQLADEPTLAAEARTGGTVTPRTDVYGFAAILARFVLGVGGEGGGLLTELEIRMPRIALALTTALSDAAEDRPSSCGAVLEAFEKAAAPMARAASPLPQALVLTPRARGTLPPDGPRQTTMAKLTGPFAPRSTPDELDQVLATLERDVEAAMDLGKDPLLPDTVPDRINQPPLVAPRRGS